MPKSRTSQPAIDGGDHISGSPHEITPDRMTRPRGSSQERLRVVEPDFPWQQDHTKTSRRTSKQESVIRRLLRALNLYK